MTDVFMAEAYALKGFTMLSTIAYVVHKMFINIVDTSKSSP
jgi:hypothetical protein